MCTTPNRRKNLRLEEAQGYLPEGVISKKNVHTILQKLLNQERYLVKPGLERTHRLLEELGNPQASFRSVLVAGTNGKGSVANFLYNIAQSENVSCGCYCSPHLFRFNERIRVGGREITDIELAEGLSIVTEATRKLVEEDPELMPSPFELFTGLAFWFFRKQGVALTVVEVGMGGRLDATNVLEPVLSLITNVGLDHQEFLGETVAEIAREKAGILRTGMPVLTTAEGEALREIEAVATGLGSPLKVISRKKAEELQALPAHAPHHQQLNAALALEAARYLDAEGILPFSMERARATIQHMKLPGRLEQRVVPTPAGGVSVLLDVGHNPLAAKEVARYLRGKDGGRGQELVVVASFQEDKDLKGFLEHFSFAREVILVPNSSSRGWSEEQRQDTLKLLRARGQQVRLEKSMNMALKMLLEELNDESKIRVLVTGSHYTVRDFVKMVENRK